jgi:hypothetical protein
METFDHIWKRLGGRKLIAFLLSLGVVCALAWTSKMTDTVMWTILGLFSSYAGGNAMEHWATAFRNRGKPMPVAALPEVEEEDEYEEEDDGDLEDDEEEIDGDLEDDEEKNA